MESKSILVDPVVLVISEAFMHLDKPQDKKAVQQAIEELSKRFRGKEKTIKLLENQIIAHESYIADIENINNEQRVSIKQLVDEKSSAMEVIESRDKELLILQKDIDAANANLHKLKNDKESLVLKLDSEFDKNQVLEGRVHELVNIKDGLSQENYHLSEELSKAIDQIEELRSQLDNQE